MARKHELVRGPPLGQWHFTLFLLATYVAIFHLWHHMDRFWVSASGIGVSVALAGALLALGRTRYFCNRWDQLFHGLLIMDILLEAILIWPQEGLGFYWCALGFGLLVGGYRLGMLNHSTVRGI